MQTPTPSSSRPGELGCGPSMPRTCEVHEAAVINPALSWKLVCLSTPGLEACRAGAVDGHVAALDGGFALREVAAQVRASALGALEGGKRDQADQRVGIAGQAAQSLGIALQPRTPPQRLAALLRERRRGDAHRGGLLPEVETWLAQRRPGCPRPEHEAFRERVRREPVGAVQAGARALADGI